MSQNQRRTRHAPAPDQHRPPSARPEQEDVKAATVPDRRILRSHYRRLKASIAEGKDHLLRDDNGTFDTVVRRADELYTLVNRPREQIADAEALLDITEAFLNQVKESRRGAGVKPADLVSAVIQNFGTSHLDSNHEDFTLDWTALGLEANAIFHDAPGMPTMLGPMDSEPKKRKVVTSRKREKNSSAEASRPQEVQEQPGVEKTETDKNIRVMFNVLRRCGEKGCDLTHLVLNRDSFSETVENIFFLSFLVKDGRAEIKIEDGQHYVVFRYAPTAAERTGKHDKISSSQQNSSQQIVNNQFVFRFDFKDWMVMKKTVEPGKELMPKRSGSHPPPSLTPIRKTSRNRGRVTLVDTGNVSDEEYQDSDEEENHHRTSVRKKIIC